MSWWGMKDPPCRHEWRKEVVAHSSRLAIIPHADVMALQPDLADRMMHGTTTYLLTCACGETRTYTVLGTPPSTEAKESA